VGLHTLGLALWRRGRYLAFPPLYLVANLLPFGAHAWLVHSAGHWDESAFTYSDRTRRPPYAQFLDDLLVQADSMLGRVFVVLIAAWFLLFLFRLITRRGKHRDLVGLSFAFAVLLYAHVFTSGFQVHYYRMLYANVAAAIALVDVVLAASRVAGWLAARVPWRFRFHTIRPAELVAGFALPALCHPALESARAAHEESRQNGGVPRWVRYSPQLERLRVGAFVRESSLPGDRVLMHSSWGEIRKEFEGDLDRDIRKDARSLRQLSGASDTLALLVPGRLSSDERARLTELCSRHPIFVLGGYVVLDTRKPFARVRAYRFSPAPPPGSKLEDYLIGPHRMPRLKPDRKAERQWSDECKQREG
jgi:hypothetical protein